jgi:hypothetical protein
MSIIKEIRYKGYDGEWSMDIMTDNIILITFDPKGDEFGAGQREYVIPEDIVSIEHNAEYVNLTLKDGGVFQFKFEIDGAFIGDMYNSDGEFIDTFACHSFWDDY